MFEIRLHIKVVSSDIPKLDKKVRKIIQQTIEQKLADNPTVFGIPLRNALSHYRKLRIGNYRVVFKIEKNIIYILIIAHRSDVYGKTIKRKV